MQMTNEKYAERLEGAAAVIEQDGWARGAMVRADDAHCIVGAIRHALGMCTRHHDTEKSYDASTAISTDRKVSRYLRQHREFNRGVVAWNDMCCDGAEEAILLLKEVAYDLARE